MQVIDALTQASYVDALTIEPFAWEAIDASVIDVPAMMQLFELDHTGSYKGGRWGEELVVEPSTIALERVGGVRFRTNPSTPTLAAEVFAVAHAEGDPIVGGLRSRYSTPRTFGPVLFAADLASFAPSAALSQGDFLPVPGSWASVLVRLEPTVLTTNWHLRAQWQRGSVLAEPFDVYFSGDGPSMIALPVMGDSVSLGFRHASGTARSMGIHAYLTTLAPLSYWNPPNVLSHVAATDIPAGGTLTFPLPLYAGNATVVLQTATNLPSPNSFLLLQGLDEAGAELSAPLVIFPDGATLVFQESVLLAPHRNQLLIHNAAAAPVQIVRLTVIGTT